MNFLSHYYFDQHSQDSNRILGTILPDLFKNANKTWNPHPEKKPELFEQPAMQNLLVGWKRHLLVDKIFHSSQFFEEKTKELKLLLIPILSESVVRPSFLAHIGLELLLDHLLITHRKIDVDSFYKNLANVTENDLNSFITLCNIEDKDHFFKFFNSFKSSRYLLSYQQIDNISYALHRICMRLWAHPFGEETKQDLTEVLEFYKNKLEENFMVIFDEIDNRLT